jgi:hypothetical protein
MAYAGEAFDHDHHALAGPQVAVEPVPERALQQGPLDLAARAGVQLGRAASAASGAQGRAAAALPSAVPPVGVLARGMEPSATSAWLMPCSNIRRRAAGYLPCLGSRGGGWLVGVAALWP